MTMTLGSSSAEAAAMPETTLPSILLVDDEPAVLDGLRRQLRRSFSVTTAMSGAEGLQILQDAALEDGSGNRFTAVMSDMRMPQMDGATFLTQVRASWPDTTRLLLTGHSDMEAAVAAVNHGQIFRFLTKPCPIDTVTSCLHDAVSQHRLVVAERELLELTLRGCIQALTDCLSLANPTAFARAARIRDLVTGLAQVLEVRDPWVPEVAAVLSQLGAVVLPESVADKLHRGAPLTASEQSMANRLPAIAEQVLARIPRLDAVRDAIRWQDQRYDGRNRNGPAGADIPLAARLLHLAVDADHELAAGNPPDHVLKDLQDREAAYDPEVLAALVQVAPFREEEPTAKRIALAQIRSGDRVDADIRTVNDTLLVGRGTLVTEQIIERLRNYNQQVPVREPVYVLRGPGAV